jgi:hypothetical protein
VRILRVVHFGVQQAAGASSVVPGGGFGQVGNVTESTGALAPEACICDPGIDAILVDSRTATTVGGTGVTFDWEAASKTLFQNAEACKRIAAGGLSPENIAEAIRTLRPWPPAWKPRQGKKTL